MVTSSPDYAITKPGINHHSRKRDKPLKTYGKRSTATPEPRETPKKRVRFADEEEQRRRQEEDEKRVRNAYKAAPSPPLSTQTSKTEQTPVEPAGKQSILNYFKRIPPTVSSPNVQKSAKRPLEEVEISVSTTIAKHTKRRRLLGLRPTQYTRGQLSEEAESALDTEKENQDPRDTASESSSEDISPSKGTRSRFGGNRTKEAARVQTTLNISSQAAFSECKVCDTVWNPLYPDDVKYHAKRHAAHLRVDKKRLENEL